MSPSWSCCHSVPSPNGLANADSEFVWTPISPSTGRVHYRVGKTLKFQTTKTQTSRQTILPFCWFEEINTKKTLQIEKSPNFRCQSEFGIIPNLDFPWFSACGSHLCPAAPPLHGELLSLSLPSNMTAILRSCEWDRNFAILRHPFGQAKRIAVIGSEGKAKSWQAIQWDK